MRIWQCSTSTMLYSEFDSLVGCRTTEYEGYVPMTAYNLHVVLSRLVKASICVTLYECLCHPYIESPPTLR